jgi:hypothetical protein
MCTGLCDSALAEALAEDLAALRFTLLLLIYEVKTIGLS